MCSEEEEQLPWRRDGMALWQPGPPTRGQRGWYAWKAALHQPGKESGCFVSRVVSFAVTRSIGQEITRVIGRSTGFLRVPSHLLSEEDKGSRGDIMKIAQIDVNHTGQRVSCKRERVMVLAIGS